ncbi:hypothetical protein ACFOGJ_18795 [Marinibaculum pumilum]|uniref:YfhO family protein n=1 Tax=Marinibaculum pumilum TaxID=1766165 RepID=A0ABV7L3W4_9PROT
MTQPDADAEPGMTAVAATGRGGRAWLEGLLLVGLGTLLYTILFARLYFRDDTVMGGDTQVLWSLNHLALYALKAYGTFLWWDPTALGGWPAYVNLSVGWFNYLGPWSLLWLGPFTLLAPLLDLSVNQVLVFQKTILCFVLNATGAWLLSREILRSRAARIFVMLGFALGAMPFQGFRDSVLWENMAPTLFLFWTLVRLVERRDLASLKLVYLFAALGAASLSYATLQVAIWWFFAAIFLIVLVHPSVLRTVGQLHVALWRQPGGRAFLAVAVLAVLAGLVALTAPVMFHLGELLRVLGIGPVDWDTDAGGNFGSLMAHHQGWSVLLTWAPFSDLYEAGLGLKNVLGDINRAGIDQRYLGIATLPLLLVALLRGERLRWLVVLLLTWFLCALFVAYTRENQAIVALMDHAAVFRNIRTIANTLPRDVPSLFLLIAAGLGVDALLRRRDMPGDGWLRVLLVLLAAAAAAALLASILPVFAAVRHSLGHIGIFLGALSLLALAMTFAAGHGARRTMAIGFLLLVACDLTLSSSHYWQRGLVWFRNAGPHSLPQIDVLRPIDSAGQNWPGAYAGVIHNAYVGPILGLRPWLVLESRPERQALLPNWNAEIRTMSRYPDASLQRDVAEMPFAAIRDIDAAELPAAGMLLHRPPSPEVAPVADAGDSDSIVLRSFAPARFEFDVQTAAPAYLLLRDNDDRFWTARVNGEAVPILRADFTQKAILLPAGEARVTFDYDPWPVRLAWWVYYLLLASLLALLLARGGGHRRTGLCLAGAGAIVLAAYGATLLLAASRADQAVAAAQARLDAGLSGTTLRLPGGREVPLRPGTVGALERVHLDANGLSTVAGWVVEPQTGMPADGVHLFVGDAYWTSVTPDLVRADIGGRVPSGFTLTGHGMDSSTIADVRAFASFPGGYAHAIGGAPVRHADPPWTPPPLPKD